MTPQDRNRGAAPAGYDPSVFPQFAVTVDIVILGMKDGQLHVMLIRRGEDPYRGRLALPGGFKRPDETLDDAAKRELYEEAHVASNALVQFRAFGDPGRDPRLDVVSVGYIGALSAMPGGVAGGDAAEAFSVPVADVRASKSDLAFDHGDILDVALEHVAEQLATTGLATSFVTSPFTIRQLRGVFEAVWGVRLDSANFHRSLLAGNWIVPTGQVAPSGAGGGRPAELFTRGDDWNHGGPLRRPDRRADS